MDTRVAEKPVGPLSVIGCLRAGFEVVGRNLWLVGLPVLLDLFLWLGPGLSIAPLVDGVVRMLRMQPLADPATARQVAQATELLEELGERSNLFAVLSGLPLLTVPSLLAQRMPGPQSPLAQTRVWQVTGAFTPLLATIVLLGLGVVLGLLYLWGLADRVAALRAPAHPALPARPDQRWTGDAAGAAPRPWLRFGQALVFGLVSVGALFLVVPLWSLALVMALMVGPFIGILFWLASIGLGAFMALHLLFVVHGVLLGGRNLLRALWESALLVRLQMPSVIGLVALIFVIYQGLGFVWALPSADSWTLLVGVVGNACIASGLTAATFVFYQERIALLPALLQARQAPRDLSGRLRL
jgi:hypothetical protein